MSSFAPSIAAVCLYLVSGGYISLQIAKLKNVQKSWLITACCLAVIAHALSIYHLVFAEDGYRLGFFVALSLITCVVNFLIAISGLRLPILNLFVFLFPFSACVIIAAALSEGPVTPFNNIPHGLFIHISLSVLAYSLLMIAALQAILLAWQNHQLRNKHATGRIRLLPPLQTMETLLFDIVWAGELTLTLSIVSGFIFLEDMFAQSLVHKTILSIFAWLLYATLLWGRHVRGWRGNSAIRWTLSGFCSLMVAYFGSKLVIELILHRTTL